MNKKLIITLLCTVIAMAGQAQEISKAEATANQLYLMGAAMQLKRMGYHMTKMN